MEGFICWFKEEATDVISISISTVILRKDGPLIKIELLGRLRFLVATRIPCQWIYRWHRRTFKFRL